MRFCRAKECVTKLFFKASIELNVKKASDIQVYNEKPYAGVLSNPILCLGDTYVARWWHCQNLDHCFYCLLRAYMAEKIKK